jgi:hypothetical protein
VGVEVIRLSALAAIVLLCAVPAHAEDRFALVVTGAAGGDQFTATFRTWEQQAAGALKQLGFVDDHVSLLSGVSGDPERSSTREHVTDAIQRIKTRAGGDDVVLVLLLGHGTVDATSAKFNLVGPDLSSGEWAELLRDMPGRLVVINTTGASFPFLGELSTRGRIVITATNSTAQRYDTVFPDRFLAAMTDVAADLDKNGRVSVWELFAYTSRTVARHYEQQGLLATEHPLLDDTGDGNGSEAPGSSLAPEPDAPPITDGALARATYLERDPIEATADAGLTALLAQRRTLEERAEALKQRKHTMAPEVWDREFEALMIELARVSRQIRAGS